MNKANLDETLNKTINTKDNYKEEMTEYKNENIECLISSNLDILETPYFEYSHRYEVDNMDFKKKNLSDTEYIDF